MVVVGAVGTVDFEEGKLGLVLFPLDQDFLELRAVEGYVLRGRLDEFCIAGKVLLTSAGGMIMPIIGDSIINRQQDLRL